MYVAYILEEIKINWKLVRTDMINNNVKSKYYRDYWKRSRYITAPSYSGLHFGHYKVAARDNQLKN